MLGAEERYDDPLGAALDTVPLTRHTSVTMAQVLRDGAEAGRLAGWLRAWNHGSGHGAATGSPHAGLPPD